MKSNLFPTAITLAATLGLVTAPLPVMAQAAPVAAQAAPDQAENTLGIPDDVTMLGEGDPNVRTATAVVNGHVITGTDVNQRLALLLAANKQELSKEDVQRARMQVLRNLIDETLQIQEAKAQEIEVPQTEVNESYARLAAENFKSDPKAMDTYLDKVGSSPASLKRQIEGELAWRRLLQRNVQPFVNVSEEEVNELLKRMEESRGTDEYRLGEIYLSATAENSAAAEENAKRIVEQLRQGGSFAAYARQFSEASTAAVGGDLGWVRLETLPTEMATMAREMQPGQLVGPFAIPGGLEIMLLIDKRQVLMADPRDALLSLKQISIGFDQGMTKEEASTKVENFAAGVKQIKGCGDAESAAQALGATVVTNDQIRVRSLPEQLQSIILDLQVGQTTPPFGSVEDGVRVLMLCGRDDPETQSGPDFATLMSQLEDDRIGKRAQRYLRDLRNDAYIEYN